MKKIAKCNSRERHNMDHINISRSPTSFVIASIFLLYCEFAIASNDYLESVPTIGELEEKRGGDRGGIPSVVSSDIVDLKRGGGAFSGFVNSEIKRGGGRGFLADLSGENKRGGGRNFQFAGDKRGGARGFHYMDEKKGGGRSFQFAGDKRGGGRGFQYMGDKRGGGRGFQYNSDEKRRGARSFQFSEDKRYWEGEKNLDINYSPDDWKRGGGRAFLPFDEKRAGARPFYGERAFNGKRGGARMFYGGSRPEYYPQVKKALPDSAENELSYFIPVNQQDLDEEKRGGGRAWARPSSLEFGGAEWFSENGKRAGGRTFPQDEGEESREKKRVLPYE